MIWQAQWGKHVTFLQEQVAKGVPVKALDQEPILDQYELYFYDVFILLCRHRSSNGFGINPLPLSDILAYLNRYPSFDDEFVIEVLSAADSEYVAHCNKDVKKGS